MSANKRHRISRARTLIIDLMYFSRSAPLIAVERSMPLPRLAAARERSPQRPAWSAIFTKGFAVAAEEFPALRQVYFSFPVPHYYEYDESTATIACELDVDGEVGVVPVRIHGPDKMALDGIKSKIVEMSDADLWRRGFYRTLAAVCGFPLFLRRPIWWMALNVPRWRRRCFGTFAVTSLAALGSELLTPRGPFTSILTYGPSNRNGVMRVRLVFDHRVYDGATAGRVLARLEQILSEEICQELESHSARLSPMRAAP